MATRRVNDPKAVKNSRPPATTPEDREKQLVALAVDQAEKLMRSGNAPAQIITHYLKLGSTREQLEQERMRHDIELMRIKSESIRMQETSERRAAEALAAFRGYATGRISEEGDEDYPA